ncbi:hypothetical protein BS50DRAFT_149404 [Corynespora cassiicola Philippines]|uniref:Transcriptional co-activator n=1 Tax=Corynespora cassiicola Philippines TaxID=1448308 RepID=A0A2T2N7I1_CORCC|nr:hypothetical protein BS50DRAFT_149404 [Corynespora cassiicola Philippines]
MAGTIRPNEMNVSTTPIMASKTLPGMTDLMKPESSKKPVAPRAPRVDVEPLYTAVKSAISDADWTTYKTSLSQYLLGNLNQEELSYRLRNILSTPALEHAHNAFMLGVYANIFRDAPEPGIASWVSSSDKPSSGVSKGTGDESEKRLKHEVMQLSRRERKRLKTIHQGEAAAGDGLNQVMQEYQDARRIKQPETGPASAGGYQKTNWDLEIRKRYTSSLFTETHEFPTASTISHRLLPICYEFGLPQGHTPDCADYMNIATETYIKELLTNILQSVNANGPGFIRTADFKRKVEREERKVERGELLRSQAGELPVEQEERRKRPLLCMEDLRLAHVLGDSYLGQVPLIAGQIMHSRFLDSNGMEDLYDAPPSHPHAGPGAAAPAAAVAAAAAAAAVPKVVNGVNGAAKPMSTTAPATVTNGFHIDLGDSMVLDEESGWQGGSVKDTDELDAALDGVLELGIS